MNTKKILTNSLAVLMIVAGIFHFIYPQTYIGFIPAFMPKYLVTYVSGVVELLPGVGLLIAKYKLTSARIVLLLMLLFLPLHIVDVFKTTPAIGSKQLAYIRLPMQFVLIYWAWYVKKIIATHHVTN